MLGRQLQTVLAVKDFTPQWHERAGGCTAQRTGISSEDVFGNVERSIFGIVRITQKLERRFFVNLQNRIRTPVQWCITVRVNHRWQDHVQSWITQTHK